MDFNAMNGITLGAAAAPSPIKDDATTSQNRQVVQAVKALNQSEMFGQENGLEFARDPDSRRWVVKVVNRTTGDVVSQIPAEYILRLSEDLKQKG